MSCFDRHVVEILNLRKPRGDQTQCLCVLFFQKKLLLVKKKISENICVDRINNSSKISKGEKQ